jgi:hypothetical protein
VSSLHAVYADICSRVSVELDLYRVKDFEACNICTNPSAKQGLSNTKFDEHSMQGRTSPLLCNLQLVLMVVWRARASVV